MRNNIKALIFLFSFLFFLIIKNYSYSYDSLFFSNNAYIEYVSKSINNNLRKNNWRVSDNGYSTISGSFASFYYFKRNDEDLSKNLFAGIDMSGERDESYSQKISFRLNIGYGLYKNPFFIYGWGYSYQKDLIFNNPKLFNFYMYINIGRYDDLHLFFKYEGGFESHRDKYNTNLQSGMLETAIGWKEAFPVFFLFQFSGQGNYIETDTQTTDLSHIIDKLLAHIQYISNAFSISAGLSLYHESYLFENYDANNRFIDGNTIAEAMYYGGGITFTLPFLTDKLLFGEFHLLGDKNKSFITISKFGTKMFF